MIYPRIDRKSGRSLRQHRRGRRRLSLGTERRKLRRASELGCTSRVWCCPLRHSGPPRRSGPEIRCSGWLAIVRAFTLAFVRLGEDLLPGQSEAATAHWPTEQCARGASLTALPTLSELVGVLCIGLSARMYTHYRCGLFALSVPLPPSQNTFTAVPALPAGRARVSASRPRQAPRLSLRPRSHPH
jgi:hypothetical protein